MSCPLARQTHRNPNAIVLEALRPVSFRRNADEAVAACKWALWNECGIMPCARTGQAKSLWIEDRR